MKVGLSLILLAISYTSSLVFNILHFSFFTDTEIDSAQGGCTSSEEQPSSNEDDAIERPKTPTGRQSKSRIWKYMSLIDIRRLKCNICDKSFKFNNSTTSHMTHLLRKHPTVVDFSSPEQSEKSAGSSEAQNNSISKKRKKDITRALTKIITVDMRPPHMMKGTGFRSAMKVIEPNYVVPHPTTFTRTYVPEAYQELKKIVLEKLKDAIHLNLSTDLWTDNFRKIAYITIVAHFITSKWKCRRYALSTRAFLDDHTGENIRRDLQHAVDEFKLKDIDATPTLVCDQGSNVLLAGRLMRWFQINCAAHVFNLAIASDGFKRIPTIMRLLKKCQDIALFLQFKSAQVSSAQGEIRQLLENMPVEFTDHCYFEEDVSIPSSAIKKDNVTRWNSKCTMIESILKNRQVIRHLLVEFHKIDLLLSDGEIYFLKCLLKFLLPFKTCTDLLQGDHYPTISLVLPMLERLSLSEEDPVDVNSEEEGRMAEDIDSLMSDFAMFKENVRKSIKTRFERSENPVYTLASALDPRWKGTRHFITSEQEFITAINNFEKALKERMVIGRPSSSANHRDFPIIPQPIQPSSSNATSINQKKKKESSVAKLLGGLLDSRTIPIENDALKKEIAFYLSTPFITKEDLESFDLLKWWKDHEKQFPLLSVVARKVLGIPATSACCERIFSKSGNVVSSLRANISPQNVDMTIFIAVNDQ